MEAGADGRTAMTSPMERPSWTDCSDRRAPHVFMFNGFKTG